MIFNQEKMIKLCKELGIEVVEGNTPLINDRPLTGEDIINIFNINNEREDNNEI